MALISSQFSNRSDPLSDKVATEDMVQRNEFGQNVVVVPKGQRIPERLMPKAKKVTGPAENKARSMPRGKSR